MSRPNMRAGLRPTLALAAVFLSAPLAQAQVSVSIPRYSAYRGPSDDAAKCEKDKITFVLPLPYERMETPKSPVTGYYVWRVSVEMLQPLSFVVTSDTALHSVKAADVLRASSVRLCADPT